MQQQAKQMTPQLNLQTPLFQNYANMYAQQQKTQAPAQNLQAQALAKLTSNKPSIPNPGKSIHDTNSQTNKIEIKFSLNRNSISSL
jgi:hypothetical protein